MISGSFPTRLENPQGINSLRCSKAKNRMTGNRCPQSGWVSMKSGCGKNAVAIVCLYVAKFEEAVYLLHVFEKRSQKTPKDDIYLARSRYIDLLKWRKEQRL
jgi:hypothetical protein